MLSFITIKQKPAIAKQLLNKQDLVDNREVIRYLIKQEQTAIISSYLGLYEDSVFPLEIIMQVSPKRNSYFVRQDALVINKW